MELIEIQRDYYRTEEYLRLSLELAYSTGRLKYRNIYLFSKDFLTFDWHRLTERFVINPQSEIANRDIERLERFVTEAIDELFDLDLSMDDVMTFIISFVHRRELAYRNNNPTKTFYVKALCGDPREKISYRKNIKTYEGFDPTWFE